MKLYLEDNQTIPAVLIMEDNDMPPIGYTDYSSDLLKWKDFALQVCTDYLQFRTYVTEQLTLKGWSNLSNDEKYFVIDNYIKEDGIDPVTTNYNKIVYLMTVCGMSQPQAISHLQKVYAIHHLKEIESCLKRAQNEKLFTVIAKYLKLEDASDFTKVIALPYQMFVTQGIKGVNDGEAGEGLFDFIESTVGTSYETAGLEQQGYIMANGDPDMSNFIVELMDILRNGNY